MSPRTEEQFEEIRKEKRQLIMDTALQLFAKHGYENTSVSQIAKQADISKGLLYNYFENKEDLLEAILNKGIDNLMAFFDPNHDGILEPHELEFFISESLKQVKENRVFWKLYLSISMQDSVFKLIENKIKEMYEPLMIMMVSYFKNAGYKNPEMEAYLFGAMMDGITFDYVMSPDLIPLDKIEKELIERYCKQ